VQILIAGGTGTGKSSLASALWCDYQVAGLLNTGDVREAIRAVTDPTTHPELFETGESGLSAVDSYQQQASTVLRATGQALRRLASPATLSGAEGMHLLPPLLADLDLAATHVIVMRQPDRTIHESRLLDRGEREGRRRWAKYAEIFDGIRAIGDYIEESWASVVDVNVHFVTSVDEGLAALVPVAGAFHR
jgi:2-phosphoglycerate kinase